MFLIDKNLFSIVKPFVLLSLETCDELIGVYMNIQKLALYYGELMSMKKISKLRRMNLIELLKTLCASKYFPNICAMLARIAAT